MAKRSKKNKYTRGQMFGPWRLDKFLAAGGNGEVWAAKNNTGATCAIKLLSKITPIPYERFKAEIHALGKHTETKGVMPIIGHFLPDELGKGVPWYSMPVCQPFEARFKKADPVQIITAFISLAETLTTLHASGVSHRDIKPGNISRRVKIVVASIGPPVNCGRRRQRYGSILTSIQAKGSCSASAAGEFSYRNGVTRDWNLGGHPGTLAV